MQKIEVLIDNQLVGHLLEIERGREYRFTYISTYNGPAVSLTMPIRQEPYVYDDFPPYFEGLLPEGNQLEGLLKQRKLDKNDYIGQLCTVGRDVVGNTTIGEEIEAVDE